MVQKKNQYEDIVAYIKSFLVYGDVSLVDDIAYCEFVDPIPTAKIVILSNGHLGKDIVFPDLEEMKYHYENGHIIISTDLVYNTFFFLSCSEELLSEKRDVHGRFIARYSVLHNGERLMRPLIDEYSFFLLSALRGEVPQSAFQHIYLTHDVDTIAHYRHLRGMVGGALRGKIKEVCKSCISIDDDPAFTFPWLIKQDARINDATSIYFMKDTPGKGFDYPQYNLYGRDCQYLCSLLYQQHAIIGWHSSYYSLDKRSDYTPQRSSNFIDYHLHRSHYLQIDIHRFQQLEKLGVTDDFSMGFADRVGFRCQTTRPFRWIDPLSFRLSQITVHPLSVMDVSLSAPHYMHLHYEHALNIVNEIVYTIKKYRGEICFLWHNTSINKENYHQNLYRAVLSLLT